LVTTPSFRQIEKRAKKTWAAARWRKFRKQTLELRVSRYIGGGLHEDIDLTNFTQEETHFTFSIEIDADFIDRQELHAGRQQKGNLEYDWHTNEQAEWELDFNYRAEHDYDHQGNTGKSTLDRGLTIRIVHADSAARFERGRLSFEIALLPMAPGTRVSISSRGLKIKC
jgi:hypothetical protein